jgi:hypothetical protein
MLNFSVEYRFDGHDINKLKSHVSLIPITSPVTSKFTAPAILRRKRKHVRYAIIVKYSVFVVFLFFFKLNQLVLYMIL